MSGRIREMYAASVQFSGALHLLLVLRNAAGAVQLIYFEMLRVDKQIKTKWVPSSQAIRIYSWAAFPAM